MAARDTHTEQLRSLHRTKDGKKKVQTTEPSFHLGQLTNATLPQIRGKLGRTAIVTRWVKLFNLDKISLKGITNMSISRMGKPYIQNLRKS